MGRSTLRTSRLLSTIYGLQPTCNKGDRKLSAQFIDPRLLDGLQNALTAVLRVVVKLRQRQNHAIRGVKRTCAGSTSGCVGELDRDFQRIGPFGLGRSHQWFSRAWLMVYFGSSTVRSSSPTFTWQDNATRWSAPRAIEQIFFVLAHFARLAEAIANDDVARGAGERLIARMLDADIGVQRGRAKADAWLRRELAPRAKPGWEQR